MVSTKPWPSESTGSPRHRIQSGVMLMISPLSTTSPRAPRSRARPSTVRSPSLHPLPSSPEGSGLDGRACPRRSPSPSSSTWPARSSASVPSTWMTSAVRPLKCAAMPSRTILTTESTAATLPAVITPMARSIAPDSLDSAGGTMDSRGWSTMSPGEQGEQRQVVAQVSGDEKVPPDVLAARRAHPTDQLRVAQELSGAKGRSFHRLHGIARDAGHDLDGYAARHAADDRLAFAHGRGHVDPDVRGQGLVQDDDGGALQRVHLGLGIRRERDDAHVGIVAF